MIKTGQQSNIETNRNPGHNHFRSQIKFKQYICCNMNRADNTVKQNNANRIVGYNSCDSHLFATWLHLNRMVFELVKRHKITIVNHNCQPYHLEYYQFEMRY